MLVVGFDGGVRIELDIHEASDLVDFLNQFYEGDESVPDILAARLTELLPIEPIEC